MMEQKRARRLAVFGLPAVLVGVTALGWWAQHALPLPAGLRPQPVLAVLPPGGLQQGAGSTGAATGTAPQPSTSSPTAEAEAAPRFDVARIGARGTAVVAGRATPGAEVLLQDREQELGRARADQRGEWVILPATPLTPGTHELSLRARLPDGQQQEGRESVVVLVPEAAATRPQPVATATPTEKPADKPAETPLAVLLPRPGQGAAAAPRILQGGQEAAPAETRAAPRTAPSGLGLDAVEYDEAGSLRFSGSAPGGSTVRVYIDQDHAGDARASAEGRWSLQPEAGTAPGLHTLRVDQLGEQGRVAARVELPFQRASLTLAPGAPGQLVVQPGNNLWRIARSTYGRGTFYTTIYRANRDQIREPHRIYPGQVFTLPSPQPAAP